MLRISFPDGRTEKFDRELNGLDIAKSISSSLAKKAVAIKVDGVLMDLTDSIVSDAKVEIVTLDSLEGLDIMRHTIAAQVLARAVKNLYPNSKLAIVLQLKTVFIMMFFLRRKFLYRTSRKLKMK